MGLGELVMLLSYCAPVILLIGIIGGTLNYKSKNKLNKLLLIYFLIAIISDILCRVLIYSVGNNLIMIPLYGLTELIIFALIYRKIFEIKSQILILFVVATSILVIIEVVSTNHFLPKNFSAYSRVLSTFSIVLMSFIFLYQSILNGQTKKSITTTFNLITLVYFTLNLILFIPVNFLITKQTHLIFYFWTFNLFATILYYGYISYLLWKNGKIPKQLQFG